LRMCVDYRALNDVTIRDAYPLPRVDALLASLAGARFFTSLDLKSGCYQALVEPGDRAKTEFGTSYGTYKFRVMPFGLKNAPGTFQRLVDSLFHDHLCHGVGVYIDDIIIYSDDLKEHLILIEIVLKRL